MKTFKIIARSGRGVSESWLNEEHDIDSASFWGWGLAEVGVQVLDQLEVGETTIDDDGDTWERVE